MNGKIGLAGSESFNMYIFPIITWLVRKWRPDLMVHCLVENAPDIEAPHREAIQRILAIPNAERYWVVRSTEKFCHFYRRWAFVGTLPHIPPAGPS